MKLAPISTDLLIKLALVAGGIGLAWYVYRQTAGRAAALAESAAQTIGEVADAVIVGTNPVNPNNWANQAVTAAGSLVVSDTGPGRNADGSWTLGGAIFDLLNPGWAQNAVAPSPAAPLPGWGREARTTIYQADSEELAPSAYDAMGNYLGAP